MALIVDPVEGAGGKWTPRRGPSAFADAGYCGHSFNQGLIRFHDAQTGPNYRALCHQAFPELRDLDRKADVLAFDWHGRQYLTAKIKGESDLQIVMADIGTGTLDVLVSTTQFAAVLRLDNVADYFDGELYDQWRAAVGHPDAGLAFTDCIEYTVPLYLGGDETLDNLTLIDLDVSWTVGAQIRAQTPRT
jgi:hypothetical protein